MSSSLFIDRNRNKINNNLLIFHENLSGVIYTGSSILTYDPDIPTLPSPCCGDKRQTNGTKDVLVKKSQMYNHNSTL